MEGVLEITATIRKEGDHFYATCPEIGLSLTSTDQDEALEYLKRWATSIMDP
ncbi:MAG: hypothetical protein ACMUHU_01210 [Thermoplasmatota archaeon]